MSGQVGILNVGAGDTKLTFDKTNPVERVRAARIVTDMIRRGYALLVLVEVGEGKDQSYTRALGFDEDTCEYIIADFDPTVAAHPDDVNVPVTRRADVPLVSPPVAEPPAKPRNGRRGARRRVPAESTSATAVARSAGG